MTTRVRRAAPAGGSIPRDTVVHWTLRIGVVACFVGHGAFGIITKHAWVPYFGVWGIPEAWAWPLMPLVGVVDISIGVLTLFRPLPAVLLWMTFWGFQTACLRPLAGEPIWELLERAGNFGVPFALLWTRGWPASSREWVTAFGPAPLTGARADQVGWILRITAAALLIGHGGFGAFMHKHEWPGYFAAVGVSGPVVARYTLVDLTGWFEIGLGLALLIRPWPGLVIFAFAWKVGTESLRPLAGEPLWEFIERGGSYAAPLALFWLSRHSGPAEGSVLMDLLPRRRHRSSLALLGPLMLVGLAVSSAARADEVTDWNITGFDVAIAGGQNPIVHSRTLTMMHLAIHDALNAIDRRYEPYLYEARAEPGASAGAAVAAAARDVLIGTLPSWGSADQRAKAQAMAEAAYTAALAKVPDGLAKNHGIAAGQAAALAMLSARKADGATVSAAYTPGTAPGQWQPTPNPAPPNPPVPPAMATGNLPAMLPQWATVTPFVMATPWQFRLPGPPMLTSQRYSLDYDEVRSLGGKSSTSRTAAQSEIAMFWYESSPVGWSRVARVVGAQRGLGLWENARLLALVNAVIADGYIAGADTRYLYNFWRPVTAIRAAGTDGNDATVPDPAWESFLNTPPLPDYPSTHSVAGGAAAAVLARFFGSDQVSFSMPSGPPFPGITRAFTSFSQAAQENADSRVYAGIHFRTACRDGVRQGEQIGRRGFAQYLQPYKN